MYFTLHRSSSRRETWVRHPGTSSLRSSLRTGASCPTTQPNPPSQRRHLRSVGDRRSWSVRLTVPNPLPACQASALFSPRTSWETGLRPDSPALPPLHSTPPLLIYEANARWFRSVGCKLARQAGVARAPERSGISVRCLSLLTGYPSEVFQQAINGHRLAQHCRFDPFKELLIDRVVLMSGHKDESIQYLGLRTAHFRV